MSLASAVSGERGCCFGHTGWPAAGERRIVCMPGQCWYFSCPVGLGGIPFFYDIPVLMPVYH